MQNSLCCQRKFCRIQKHGKARAGKLCRAPSNFCGLGWVLCRGREVRVRFCCGFILSRFRRFRVIFLLDQLARPLRRPPKVHSVVHIPCYSIHRHRRQEFRPPREHHQDAPRGCPPSRAPGRLVSEGTRRSFSANRECVHANRLAQEAKSTLNGVLHEEVPAYGDSKRCQKSSF